MIAGIKGWLKQKARNRGYDIMRIDASGWYPYYLEYLGFQPRTVVDVGVGEGTSVLYRTFPHAYHVLIEPLAVYEPVMHDILRRYRGEYHLTALGAREEERQILVDPEWVQRSSFLVRSALEGNPAPVRGPIVPVTTLDALCARRALEPPFGLKLDVEGYELEVLAGATAFLQQTEFVIAEVAVARRFAGGYSFAEFIAFMDGHGFRLCEVLDVAHHDGQGAAFIDGVFRRD